MSSRALSYDAYMNQCIELEKHFRSFISTRSLVISQIQKEIEKEIEIEIEISLTKLELIYDILYANTKIDKTINKHVIRKDDFMNCLILLDIPFLKIKSNILNETLKLRDAIIITILLINSNS